MGCPPTGGFSLYYYGPFSEEIEELLQTMHTTGLISFEEGDLMYLSRIGWDMIAKKGSIFGEKVAEKIRKWADMNLKDLIELACYEASERRRVTGVL